jgi:hypothetical protein
VHVNVIVYNAEIYGPGPRESQRQSQGLNLYG